MVTQNTIVRMPFHKKINKKLLLFIGLTLVITLFLLRDVITRWQIQLHKNATQDVIQKLNTIQSPITTISNYECFGSGTRQAGLMSERISPRCEGDTIAVYELSKLDFNSKLDSVDKMLKDKKSFKYSRGNVHFTGRQTKPDSWFAWLTDENAEADNQAPHITGMYSYKNNIFSQLTTIDVKIEIMEKNDYLILAKTGLGDAYFDSVVNTTEYSNFLDKIRSSKAEYVYAVNFTYSKNRFLRL